MACMLSSQQRVIKREFRVHCFGKTSRAPHITDDGRGQLSFGYHAFASTRAKWRATMHADCRAFRGDSSRAILGRLAPRLHGRSGISHTGAAGDTAVHTNAATRSHDFVARPGGYRAALCQRRRSSCAMVGALSMRAARYADTRSVCQESNHRRSQRRPARRR